MGGDGEYYVDGGMRLLDGLVYIMESFVQEWIDGLWVLVVLESGVQYMVVVVMAGVDSMRLRALEETLWLWG